MPNEFIVVGEDRADSQWLLVQGSDGRYYSYHPLRRRLKRVEADERWVRYNGHENRDDEPERSWPKNGT